MFGPILHGASDLRAKRFALAGTDGADFGADGSSRVRRNQRPFQRVYMSRMLRPRSSVWEPNEVPVMRRGLLQADVTSDGGADGGAHQFAERHSGCSTDTHGEDVRRISSSGELCVR